MHTSITIRDNPDRILTGLEGNIVQSESLNLFVQAVKARTQESVYWVTNDVPTVRLIFDDVDDIVVDTSEGLDHDAITDIVRQIIGEVWAEGEWICVYDPWVDMTGAH